MPLMIGERPGMKNMFLKCKKWENAQTAMDGASFPIPQANLLMYLML